MSKQISTKTTIRNLTAEIKKTFVKKDAFTPVETAANAAIKAVKVTGNTVNFYTNTGMTGAAAFSMDFPTEMFLDQTKTAFVGKFKFSDTTYPGATDPKLDGKPVMVLAVKGENPDSCTYSFLNMAALDGEGNLTDSGKKPADFVAAETGKRLMTDAEGEKLAGVSEGATKTAASSTNGNVNIDGKEVVVYTEPENVLHDEDVEDFSAEEIAALLAD